MSTNPALFTFLTSEGESRPGEQPPRSEVSPAVGSPEDAAVRLARLRALMAGPADERRQVLAAAAVEAAVFYGSPEGRAEWEAEQEEMADWHALDGLPFEGFEDEDASEERAA